MENTKYHTFTTVQKYNREAKSIPLIHKYMSDHSPVINREILCTLFGDIKQKSHY